MAFGNGNGNGNDNGNGNACNVMMLICSGPLSGVQVRTSVPKV